MTDVPQLAFPVRVVAGQFVQVEQGGVDDVRGQVHLLALTPPGHFGHGPNDPLNSMGLADQAHRQHGPNLAEIDEQITQHVPDAKAALEEDLTALDQGLAKLNVRIRSEGSRG